MKQGSFCWYELMTSDLDGAQVFYASVAGWSVRDAGMAGMRYLLGHAGDRQISGMMAAPQDAQGMPPVWFGYVAVADVDAMAQAVAKEGGSVHRPPMDIPGVGRFAVVADPQGAVFMLFCGDGEEMDAPAMGTPGCPGWHELHSSDWEGALVFYGKLFGWSKSDTIDMGPMGLYQTFQAGDTHGGMFNDPAAQRPYWLYYIAVDDIDAGLGRVIAGGGTLINGPMQVPGGIWVLEAKDPQGALFALMGPKQAET